MSATSRTIYVGIWTTFSASTAIATSAYSSASTVPASISTTNAKRYVLNWAIGAVRRRAHAGAIGESLQQRCDVICEHAIVEPCFFQDVPGQNVEVELRRDAQRRAVFQEALEQPRMIEDRIARISIGQEVNEVDGVPLGSSECLHHEVEVLRCESVPTIGSYHRDIT